MSNHARSHQIQEDTRRKGPNTPKGKKNTAANQPGTPQKAKKYKPMDSDEVDEKPQNERGTSSKSQTIVPVLPLHQGLAASSQGPAASANSGEFTAMSTVHRVKTLEEQYSVQISTFDQLDYWTMTLKYSRSSRITLFCYIKNGDQQDICNLATMPCLQRSSYLNELTNNFSNTQIELPNGVDGRTRDELAHCMTTFGKAAGIKAQRRSRARQEASAQEVRGFYTQFAETKKLEYKSWVDNEVFDLVDLRKVKPRNYVTGRWVLTTAQDSSHFGSRSL